MRVFFCFFFPCLRTIIPRKERQRQLETDAHLQISATLQPKLPSHSEAGIIECTTKSLLSVEVPNDIVACQPQRAKHDTVPCGVCQHAQTLSNGIVRSSLRLYSVILCFRFTAALNGRLQQAAQVTRDLSMWSKST